MESGLLNRYGGNYGIAIRPGTFSRANGYSQASTEMNTRNFSRPSEEYAWNELDKTKREYSNQSDSEVDTERNSEYDDTEYLEEDGLSDHPADENLNYTEQNGNTDQYIEEEDYDIEYSDQIVEEEGQVIHIFAVDPELDLEYSSDEKDDASNDNEDDIIVNNHDSDDIIVDNEESASEEDDQSDEGEDDQSDNEQGINLNHDDHNITIIKHDVDAEVDDQSDNDEDIADKSNIIHTEVDNQSNNNEDISDNIDQIRVSYQGDENKTVVRFDNQIYNNNISDIDGFFTKPQKLSKENDDFTGIFKQEKVAENYQIIEDTAEMIKCNNRVNDIKDPSELAHIEHIKKFLTEDFGHPRSFQKSTSLPHSPHIAYPEIDDHRTTLSFEDLNILDLNFEPAYKPFEFSSTLDAENAKNDDCIKTLSEEDIKEFLITDKPKEIDNQGVYNDENGDFREINNFGIELNSKISDKNGVFSKITNITAVSKVTITKNLMGSSGKKGVFSTDNRALIELPDKSDDLSQQDMEIECPVSSQIVYESITSDFDDKKRTTPVKAPKILDFCVEKPPDGKTKQVGKTVKLEQEDFVDVESVTETVTVLEANNLNSLLEQFEASEKMNKGKVSKALEPLVVEKTSLKTPIENQVKVSNGTRLQDAAVQLNKNKLKHILMSPTNTGSTQQKSKSIHSDHDYCSPTKKPSIPIDVSKRRQSLLKPEVLTHNQIIKKSRHRTCKEKKVIYNVSSDDETKDDLKTNNKSKTVEKASVKTPVFSNHRKKADSPTNTQYDKSSFEYSVIAPSLKVSDKDSQNSGGSIKLTIKNKSKVILQIDCDTKDSVNKFDEELLSIQNDTKNLNKVNKPIIKPTSSESLLKPVKVEGNVILEKLQSNIFDNRIESQNKKAGVMRPERKIVNIVKPQKKVLENNLGLQMKNNQNVITKNNIKNLPKIHHRLKENTTQINADNNLVYVEKINLAKTIVRPIVLSQVNIKKEPLYYEEFGLNPINKDITFCQDILKTDIKIKKEVKEEVEAKPQKKKLNLQEYKKRREGGPSTDSSRTVSPEAIFPNEPLTFANGKSPPKETEQIKIKENMKHEIDLTVEAEPKKIFDPILEASRKILQNTKKQKAEAIRKRDEDIVMSKIPKVENLELQPLISDVEMLQMTGLAAVEEKSTLIERPKSSNYVEIVMVSIGVNTETIVSVPDSKSNEAVDDKPLINFRIKKSDTLLKQNVFDKKHSSTSEPKSHSRSPHKHDRHSPEVKETKLDEQRFKNVTATLKSVKKSSEVKISSNSLFASIQDVVRKNAPDTEQNKKERQRRSEERKRTTPEKKNTKLRKHTEIIREYDSKMEHGEDKVIIHLQKDGAKPESKGICIQTEKDPEFVDLEFIDLTYAKHEEIETKSRKRHESDVTKEGNYKKNDLPRRSLSKDRNYRHRSRSKGRHIRKRSYSRSRSRSPYRYRSRNYSYRSRTPRRNRSRSRDYRRRHRSPSHHRVAYRRKSRSLTPKKISGSPQAKKVKQSPEKSEKIDVNVSATNIDDGIRTPPMPPVRKPTISESSDSSSSSMSSSSSSSSSSSGSSCSSKRARSCSQESFQSKSYRRDDSVRRSSVRSESLSSDGVTPVEERRIVFVGKLTPDMNKTSLRSMFSKFGPINEITLHTKDNGNRYGFVTFRLASDAWSAVEASNTPPFNKHDVGFGGRRAFCGQRYKDLDGLEAVYSEIAYQQPPAPPIHQTEDLSFDQMLQDMKKKLSKRKKLDV